MKKRARIMEKLEIWPTTSINFQILIEALKTILHYSNNIDMDSLGTLYAPALDNLKRLDPDEMRYIISGLISSEILFLFYAIFEMEIG